MVFDITNRNTFNALQNWLEDARTLASPHIVILLVGNKKDLESERDVTFLEASQFAQDNGICCGENLLILFYIIRCFCFTCVSFFQSLFTWKLAQNPEKTSMTRFYGVAKIY